jgi:hypothetical protein
LQLGLIELLKSLELNSKASWALLDSFGHLDVLIGFFGILTTSGFSSSSLFDFEELKKD